MATSKIKGLDEPTLEGGGGGGGMGRGSSTQIKGHRSDPIIEKLQDKLGVDKKAVPRIIKEPEVIDLSKGSKSMLEEAERNKALDQFRRKKALSEATTEGGVTKYPYIEPTSKKAGGTVTASRRADGIAMRGKTRGKMC